MKLQKLFLMSLLASGLLLSSCGTTPAPSGDSGGNPPEDHSNDEKAVIDLDNGKATFGIFPQTVVSDAELKSQLLSLLPSDFDSHGYAKIGDDYYYGTLAHPISEYSRFSDGSLITDGELYFFKCEPIVWNILSNESSGYVVMSEKILSAQYFYRSTDHTHSVEGESFVVYDCNYKYSDVRNFLTTTFIDKAFINGTSAIKATTIQSPDDGKDWETTDLAYLPSQDDLKNTSYGFDSSDTSTSRCAKFTDYAVAMGLDYSDWGETIDRGCYWTRTSVHIGGTNARYVDTYGCLRYQKVNNEHYGVRPMMTLAK